MKWTILGIVEIVIAVALTLWLLAVFFGGSSGRLLADKYDAFEDKLLDGNSADAAKLATDVAGRVRKGHALRLEAAGLKYAAGDLAGAKALCSKLAADKGCPKPAKAQAKVILAAAAVKKTNSEKALAAAEKHAREAVEIAPGLGDARAALGIILARKGQRADAVTVLGKAVTAQTPPSKELLAQAYVARGHCRLLDGKPLKASVDFRRALAVRPGWKKARALLFTARLSCICTAAVPRPERDAVLAALRADASVRKEFTKPLSMLARGVANHISGKKRDAEAAFKAASKDPSTKGRAAADLAVLMLPDVAKILGGVEEKRQGLIAKALHAASGEANPWKTVPPGKDLGLGSAEGQRLTGRDIRALIRPRDALEGLLSGALGSGTLPPEQESRVRRAIAILAVWKYVHAPKEGDVPAALGNAIAALKPLADEAKDPWAAKAYGALLLKAGREIEAVAALRVAGRLAPDDTEIATFVKTATAKPTFSDLTPSAGSSLYLRPLIGCTIQVNAGPAQAADGTVTMKVNGEEVVPETIGSNVSYIPAAPLKDGQHTVSVSFADPYGNKAERTFKFYIDNAPPSVTRLTPGQNEAVAGPRPRFVLEYGDDGSGVDPTTVTVLMYPVQAAGPAFRDLIIKAGVYQFTSFSEPKFRRGDPVGQGKVIFTSKRNLQAGTYRIEFDFADNRDIHVKQKNWIFRIE